ncbi:uncharacterized protein LOC129594341 [Paramacrobiotus metropolitanus]|uniref:uncharacterized protein LOC129594341 n=1 Tax=Paramacrobiotus metropolitanus TaxID=2943436 RepID=UPI0024462BD7|nr:uncharacterized protein LOC129594341 [Paramacrobiotus metropolitanus]
MRRPKPRSRAPKRKNPEEATASANGSTAADSAQMSVESPESPESAQPAQSSTKTTPARVSPRVTRSGKKGPQPRAPLTKKSAAPKKAKTEPITFQELADRLEPHPQPATNWRKFIDRNEKMLMFYDLDLKAPIPKISRSVQVRCTAVKTGKKKTEYKLVPTVHIDGKIVSPASIKSVIKGDYVETIDDLTKLVNHFGVLENLHNMKDGEDGSTNLEDGKEASSADSLSSAVASSSSADPHAALSTDVMKE